MHLHQTNYGRDVEQMSTYEIVIELIERQLHTNGLEFVPLTALATLQQAIKLERETREAHTHKGVVRYA